MRKTFRAVADFFKLKKRRAKAARTLAGFPGAKPEIRPFEYAAWLAAAAVVFFLAARWHAAYFNSVTLEPLRPVFYRDEFIEARLSTRNSKLLKKWRQSPPPVFVVGADGSVSRSIGGLSSVYWRWDGQKNEWRGVFPCPWNAPAGSYGLRLEDAEVKLKFLHVKPFSVACRKPEKLPAKIAALTVEYAGNYAGIRMTAPDGQAAGRDAIARWAQYLGANTVWILVGKTTGKDGQIWDPVNAEAVRSIGAQCHKTGIKFGVWAMCYLTQPAKPWLSRYKWAEDVENGLPKKVRSISLSDPLRPGDIASLLGRFSAMPEVDYVGLDYIRNALGGYELAEEFFAEMPWVRKPQGWEKMSYNRRLAAFASVKIARKDKEFIDAWQWWRAHKAAAIVREIKTKLPGGKRLWVFTLGWERGWQHGQDAAMMNDAGADLDAIMLYEADAAQFSEMMNDWHSYLKKTDAQLVVGDVIDWPLHQGAGLDEFTCRMGKAARQIYRDGPARGIFIHDLTRLLWGRKGPYSTDEWAQAAKTAVQDFLALPQK